MRAWVLGLGFGRDQHLAWVLDRDCWVVRLLLVCLVPPNGLDRDPRPKCRGKAVCIKCSVWKKIIEVAEPPQTPNEMSKNIDIDMLE